LYKALDPNFIGIIDLARPHTPISDDVQDAQREWLILEGFAPESNQDMFYEYLRANGYVGDYSDMKTQFWKDQGCTA